MEDRLIVGYDGSEPSGEAVRWAAAEAERRDAVVRVVGCYTVPIMTDYWGSVSGAMAYDDAVMRVATETRVDAMVAATQASFPEVTFEREVVLGGARQVLVEQAEQADLLVIGTKGAGGAGSTLLGAVAYSVAHHSPCPVVLVPALAPTDVQGRLIVGVDGSAAAEAALEWAADEADLRGSELIVVHAWSYPYSGESGAFQARDLTRVDAALVLEAAVARGRDRSCLPDPRRTARERPRPGNRRRGKPCRSRRRRLAWPRCVPDDVVRVGRPRRQRSLDLPGRGGAGATPPTLSSAASNDAGRTRCRLRTSFWVELLLASDSSPRVHRLAPFIEGMVALAWATITFWLPVMVAIGIWRHLIHRLPLRYHPSYWALVFPLGMYPAATHRMLAATALARLHWLPQVMLAAALAAWTATAFGLVHQAVRRLARR